MVSLVPFYWLSKIWSTSLKIDLWYRNLFFCHCLARRVHTPSCGPSWPRPGHQTVRGEYRPGANKMRNTFSGWNCRSPRGRFTSPLYIFIGSEIYCFPLRDWDSPPQHGIPLLQSINMLPENIFSVWCRVREGNLDFCKRLWSCISRRLNLQWCSAWLEWVTLMSIWVFLCCVH